MNTDEDSQAIEFLLSQKPGHSWSPRLGGTWSLAEPRLHCSGCGSATLAQAAGVVTVFFTASVRPSPAFLSIAGAAGGSLQRHPGLLSKRQLKARHPVWMLGLSFRCCVWRSASSDCISPPPSPHPPPPLPHFLGQWCTPQDRSAGGTAAAPGDAGCRGGAEPSGAGAPPVQGCHINRFSIRAPHCRCSVLECSAASPPGWNQAPHAARAPRALLSALAGLCQATLPGAFCFSQ